MLGAGGPRRDVFSESLYPQRHFGSRALSALRSGHYKYIEAPRPEFYDLARDPGELTNLYPSKLSVASAYRERLTQLRTVYKARTQAGSNALSPEAIERLHAAVEDAHPAVLPFPGDSTPRDGKALVFSPDRCASGRGCEVSKIV